MPAFRLLVPPLIWSSSAPVPQLQLPTALTCNPVTTNISGTPIYSPVDYILATQPAGPPDTIPSCSAGMAYPTSLVANTTSGGLSYCAWVKTEKTRSWSCLCKCSSQAHVSRAKSQGQLDLGMGCGCLYRSTYSDDRGISRFRPSSCTRRQQRSGSSASTCPC